MLETLSLCQRRGESAEGEGRAARENGSIAVCTWPREDIGRLYPQVQRNLLIKRELKRSIAVCSWPGQDTGG